MESQICVQKKMSSKLQKIHHKQQLKKQKIIDLQMDDCLFNSVMNRLKLPFQLELFQKEQINDTNVKNLSQQIACCDHNKELDIQIMKKWHVDQSDLSDESVKDLSHSIYSIDKLQQLTLKLNGWGYWNQSITNNSLNYIRMAVQKQHKLQEINIDLNMWAYENQGISDEGARMLLNGIAQLNQLGKLELNMKGWGDSNVQITDDTINNISKCLSKLDKLTELKLVLWENVSQKAVKDLNKTISRMENLTKIDLKFESSSTIQRTPMNVNLTEKIAKIKLNAMQKRRLLFQTNAITVIFQNELTKPKIWNIVLKL
ncbi:hypothetical protein pb186bvf_004804 [Paramecium bursaria]